MQAYFYVGEKTNYMLCIQDSDYRKYSVFAIYLLFGEMYNNKWGKHKKRIVVLGTDPTAPINSGTDIKPLQYPFGLESYFQVSSHLNNPYFWSIYRNLAYIFERDVYDAKFAEQLYNNICVMNALSQPIKQGNRYLNTSECKKTYWTKQFEENGKQHLIDSLKGETVFLTSKSLFWIFESDKELQANYEKIYHGECDVNDFIKSNEYNATFFLLFRHYKYALWNSGGIYDKYVEKIRKVIYGDNNN